MSVITWFMKVLNFHIGHYSAMTMDTDPARRITSIVLHVTVFHYM